MADPERFDRRRGLTVQMIGDRARRRIWNTPIADEHPHGRSTFVGCQVRHLVRAEAGWLGAVGFSAAASHPESHDRWIVWSAQQRAAEHNAAATFMSCTPVRVTAAYVARDASLNPGAATNPAVAEARLEAGDPFLLPLGAGSGLRLFTEGPKPRRDADHRQ